MSFLDGIAKQPGLVLDNTIQPLTDATPGLNIWQHSDTQSAGLLQFYNHDGTVLLGGIGPNASCILKGLALNVTPKTANYTTLGTDYYVPVDATAGPVTITLKPSTGTPFGSQQRVTKTDASANAVTVQRGGADTINGGTTVVLSGQNDTAVLQSDGNGTWNAVTPVSLAPAVILAPNSVNRNLIQPAADGDSLTLRPFSDVQTSPILRVQDALGTLQWVDLLSSQQAALGGPDAVTLALSSRGGLLNLTDAAAASLICLSIRSVATLGNNFFMAQDKAANITHVMGLGFGNSFYVSNTSTYGSFDTPCQINADAASTVDIIQATVGTSFGNSPVAGGVFNVDLHGDFRFERLSSTATSRPVARTDATFADSTDATRKGRLAVSAIDAAGTREGLRIEADGAAARIGFLGATAAVRQTGGAATATLVYTATEQGMLNAAYQALRVFGFLT